MTDKSGCVAADLTREQVKEITRLARELVEAEERYDSKDTSENRRLLERADEAHFDYKAALACCAAMSCFRSTKDHGGGYCRLHDFNPHNPPDYGDEEL